MYESALWQVADLSSTACGRLINTAKELEVLLPVGATNENFTTGKGELS